ncbi:MAG: hypothetical protein HY335_05105 [Deinococcus sp.]|nr:hypothetical protein [Deinococcus sp.]
MPKKAAGTTATSTPTQPVGHTRHGELTLDQLAGIQPGLGRLMVEVGERYWILYYAAQGGNWELAAHQLHQIQSLFKAGAITRPKMAKYLEAYDQGYLAAMAAAIEARDLMAFEKAYRRGIDGANALHQATGHGEIQWQLPPTPPLHLALGPRKPKG